MRKLILNIGLIMAAFVVLNAFTHQEIDYKSKALLKSLRKSGIENYSDLKAIKLPDSLQDDYYINGMFFYCPDSPEECNIKYVYVGRVNTCRAGGCSTEMAESQDLSSEYFDYFILFDEKKTVQLVKVYNYQATHGYEIMAKGWLKQFIGYKASETLKIDKDIDSVSGATISVYSITADIEAKTRVLKSKL